MRTGLATTAALLGGLAPATGLARRVCAVPALAVALADPAASPARAEAVMVTFEMLNLWGGVAIGEHLGQALTAGWIASTVLLFGQTGRVVRWARWLAVVGVSFGLGEGLALALGQPGAWFALGTIFGYLAMSVWMLVLGMTLWSQGAGFARPVAA